MGRGGEAGGGESLPRGGVQSAPAPDSRRGAASPATSAGRSAGGAGTAGLAEPGTGVGAAGRSAGATRQNRSSGTPGDPASSAGGASGEGLDGPAGAGPAGSEGGAGDQPTGAEEETGGESVGGGTDGDGGGGPPLPALNFRFGDRPDRGPAGDDRIRFALPVPVVLSRGHVWTRGRWVPLPTGAGLAELLNEELNAVLAERGSPPAGFRWAPEVRLRVRPDGAADVPPVRAALETLGVPATVTDAPIAAADRRGVRR